MPDFLSVVDDPTLTTFDGHTLMGNYEVDDEGVKASRVSLIEKGQLVSYLLSREPIRDFPSSNGHGRASVTGPPTSSLGNLIVQSSDALSSDELKKKLIEACKQRNLPYGYFVRDAGAAPDSATALPRLNQGRARGTGAGRGVWRPGHARPAQ